MKNLLLIFVLLLSVSRVSAQHIGGLYTGTLVNDSTKMIQKYELALNEYRDKIWGYSYTTFIANDTFYYGIKKVTGYKKNGELIIEDEKMLQNNFPESPAKKVKRTNVIKLTDTDTLRNINGSWHTNRTKIYYSVAGSLDLKRTTDSSISTLVAHLEELDIIKPASKEAVATRRENKVVPKTEALPQKKQDAQPSPVPYHQRSERVFQVLEISSDSLELSIYDNGVVDGDSISVYLNDKNIVLSTRLTATATKKMIQLDNLVGELKLLLVAENLGTIPPNTGLLIIKDGDKTYQVNFSADMQTNAAILIRKNK